MDCTEECVSISLYQHINFCGIVLFITFYKRAPIHTLAVSHVALMLQRLRFPSCVKNSLGRCPEIYSDFVFWFAIKYPFVIGQLHKKKQKKKQTKIFFLWSPPLTSTLDAVQIFPGTAAGSFIPSLHWIWLCFNPALIQLRSGGGAERISFQSVSVSGPS